MKRYKLVRIRDNKYISANTRYSPLIYEVGEITTTPGKGVACYKSMEYADTFEHIQETMTFFNYGEPIAILEVEPIGRTVWRAKNYGRGGAYEGGINYRGVRVLNIAKTIREYK